MIQLKTIDGAPAPIKRSPPLKMLIADIDIGERHRKEMGDLEGLADSILDQGLLQPIGVTENRELVFGERRLRACRDILGWKDIDCRVVNVSSIVEGERAENEIRKQFSVWPLAKRSRIGWRGGRESE
jgi:ParB/RepB/Spo0J family partition protein